MKKIIGFIGDHKSGRTTASNILKKKGFHVVSINDKVIELASYLFSDEELNKNRSNILNGVRRRGYNVFKEYWVNLALVSVPENSKMVVFNDLSVDELQTDKIDVYQIYRPGVSRERLDNIETIENNGTLADFEKKIEEFFRRIMPKNVAQKP